MKKVLLILGAIILILVLLFAFKNQILNLVNKPDQEKTPIKLTKVAVSFQDSDVIEAPMAVAIKQGLFEKYGLDVKSVKTIKSISSSLSGGQADISIAPPSTFLMAAAKGLDIKYVGTAANDQPQVFVSYKDPDEIKLIGINRVGGEGHIRTLKFLNAMGIDKDSVNLQSFGDRNETVLLLADKKVDAAAFGKAIWYLFKNKNKTSDEFKIIGDSSNLKEVSSPMGMYTKTEFLNNNKEALVNFSKAIIEANYWIQNNSEEKVAKEITGVNGVTQENAPIFAKLYKEALNNTKFTPDAKRLELIRVGLEEFAPQTEDYDINKFISLEVANSLKEEEFLSKFGY
jgi:ABC-type nitrate/sulfonate/bicarbonate transport system substrate-binding protein